MFSPGELATHSDQVPPQDGRLSAPPWVIATLGALLVLAGSLYFVRRVRQGQRRVRLPS
jgi:hypothetical protein